MAELAASVVIAVGQCGAASGGTSVWRRQSDCCITEKVFLSFGCHEGTLLIFLHTARQEPGVRFADVHADYVKWTL
jgi:coenzyme F420-reducing hydrogenase gamma subunit